MPKISSRHALTMPELTFCKTYKAGLDRNEAWRRAYPEEAKKLSSAAVTKRSAALEKRPHIAAFLAELEAPAVGGALTVLEDQMAFGDATAARRAAEKVLEQQDKMGFRDAISRYFQILREIGAEIEVPLPSDCPHCGEPLYASAPVEKMFPAPKEKS